MINKKHLEIKNQFKNFLNIYKFIFILLIETVYMPF